MDSHTVPEPGRARERPSQLRLRIEARYSGFPGLALGGYVAGLLAREGGPRGALEVRLQHPVAIGDDVSVNGDALLRDGVTVASARRIDLRLWPPRAVSRQEAEVASASYIGLAHHLFPGCFCCGPGRSAGDGLRIFAGPAAHSMVASPWRPADAVEEANVPTEILWSALDCPAIWAQVLVTRATGERAVTGSLAVAQLQPVPARETQLVVGWPIGRDGRKIHVGAAITSEHGVVLAVARQTLIVTERGVPLDIEAWQGAPPPEAL